MVQLSELSEMDVLEELQLLEATGELCGGVFTLLRWQMAARSLVVMLGAPSHVAGSVHCVLQVMG
jgi:hypothetical protein